ncbi:hypothetical protein HK096_009951 [Nowakowskiella sp. JEL0078]|nr:hypothetical protein HK096_009951 [Nowakowskiella sp. JEL0078]
MLLNSLINSDTSALPGIDSFGSLIPVNTGFGLIPNSEESFTDRCFTLPPLSLEPELISSQFFQNNELGSGNFSLKFPLSPALSTGFQCETEYSCLSETESMPMLNESPIFNTLPSLGSPPPDMTPSDILAELSGVSRVSRQRNIAEKIFSCPVTGCGQTFTRQFNLRTHAKTHDPDRIRPFQCASCPKQFCRQHDLDRHATVHTKVRAFRCVYCARPFTRKDAMNRHIQIRKCHVLRAVDSDAGVAAAVMAAVVASSGNPV